MTSRDARPAFAAFVLAVVLASGPAAGAAPPARALVAVAETATGPGIHLLADGAFPDVDVRRAPGGGSLEILLRGVKPQVAVRTYPASAPLARIRLRPTADDLRVVLEARPGTDISDWRVESIDRGLLLAPPTSPTWARRSLAPSLAAAPTASESPSSRQPVSGRSSRPVASAQPARPAREVRATTVAEAAAPATRAPEPARSMPTHPVGSPTPGADDPAPGTPSLAADTRGGGQPLEPAPVSQAVAQAPAPASQAVAQALAPVSETPAPDADAQTAAPPPVARDVPASPPEVTRTLDPVVAEAVAPAELPEDPSAFTTVIEVDDYRGERKTIEDLLSTVPGVQVRRLGGRGQPSEVSIRGSTSSQVVIQLDGVRLNSAQSGGVDLSTLPIDALERVEVSRGGGSLQAGGDAIGGVINLVTRRAGGKPTTRVTAEGESFGTFSGSIFRSGTLHAFEYAAGYNGFITDGDWDFLRPVIEFAGTEITFDPPTIERINNDVERHGALVKVGRDIGDHVYLSFTNDFAYVDRGTPGLDSGGGEFGGQRTDAREERLRNLATLGADWGGVFGFDGRLQVYHRYERTQFEDPFPNLGPPIDTDNRNSAFGTEFSAHRPFDFWGTQHDVLLLLDARQDRLESDEFIDTDRVAFGVAIQDDIAFWERRVRIIPGLRFDRTEGFDSEWIPRVGVVFEPWRWLRFKGNAERSYRPPNFDELFFPDKGFIRGNPGLQPEVANNYDAGVELGFDRLGPFRNVRLEAAWFRNDIEDSIVFVLVSPFTVAPVNTGAATVEGYEAQLSFGLTDWARLTASFTEFDATRDATGTPLPGRADRQGDLRLELGRPEGFWKLVGEVHHVGEIPVSPTGRSVVADRTTYDASLAFRLSHIRWVRERLRLRDLIVSVGGTNLTDQAVRDAAFFPQPGRLLFIRAEAGF